MAVVAADSSTASEVAKPKAKKPTHPPYETMIKEAIYELDSKIGSSKAAILKYVMRNYEVGQDTAKVNVPLCAALKRAVTKGDIKQVKGRGAIGSFKLSSAAEAALQPVPEFIIRKPPTAAKVHVARKAAAPKSLQTEAKSSGRSAVSVVEPVGTAEAVASEPIIKGRYTRAAAPKALAWKDEAPKTVTWQVGTPKVVKLRAAMKITA